MTGHPGGRGKRTRAASQTTTAATIPWNPLLTITPMKLLCAATVTPLLRPGHGRHPFRCLGGGFFLSGAKGEDDRAAGDDVVRQRDASEHPTGIGQRGREGLRREIVMAI